MSPSPATAVEPVRPHPGPPWPPAAPWPGPGDRVVAAAVSLFLPGSGQVLLGRPWRGVAWMGVCTLAFATLPWTGFYGLAAAMASRWLPPIDAFIVRPGRRPRAVVIAAGLAGLAIAIVTFGAAVYLRGMVPVVVADGRMAPTLHSREVAMVDRFHRRPGLDAIASVAAPGERDYAFSRVVGRAGDRIEIRDGVLIRNGVEIRRRADRRAGVSSAPTRVPAGQVFLLNDDRADVRDSRTWGPIALDRIDGVVHYAVLTRAGLHRDVE